MKIKKGEKYYIRWGTKLHKVKILKLFNKGNIKYVHYRVSFMSKDLDQLIEFKRRMLGEEVKSLKINNK